ASFQQSFGSISYDTLSCNKPRGYRDITIFCCARCYRTHFGGVVGLHYIDKRTPRSPLNGRCRHDNNAALDIYKQPGIDELVREQLVVLVGEYGLELDSAGGRIN